MSRLLAFLPALIPLAAASQTVDPASFGGSPAAYVRLEAIGSGLEESFEQALALYDAEIATQPYRVRGHIVRCEFVESFPNQYEYVTFSDEIYERAEQCERDLLSEFPDNPEVKLWQLSRTYGDEERLAAGQELLSVVDVHGWTPGQRARLYTELANASERLDAERLFRGRTAQYAQLALEQDVRADVRLILGAYFYDEGDRAAALEALTSPFDGHPPDDSWYLVRKMAYLAELGARDAVLALHAKLDSAAYYDRTEAAAALRAVGEIELAQRELDSAADYYGTADERQRFLLALDARDADAAHAAYESLRDGGFWEDPIGVNRFALFVAHPALPWRARDLLGWLGALALLAVAASIWWVPLAFVHYRGLANRLRGAAWLSTEGLGLRDAWWGLAAFSLSSFLALYTIGPFDVFTDPAVPWAIAAEQPQLAKLLVVESWLGILFLGIVVQRLRPHFAQWWATDWSIGKCVLAGVAAGLFFRVPLLAMIATGFDTGDTVRVDNAMWQTLIAVDERYGAAATLWVLAVAAPVGEELLFRGLLLRAALRHISFPVANALQASLFAALHLDVAVMPFLFVFGLAAGWLARRSGGLLAPMIMHAVLNAVAGFMITA